MLSAISEGQQITQASLIAFFEKFAMTSILDRKSDKLEWEE